MWIVGLNAVRSFHLWNFEMVQSPCSLYPLDHTNNTDKLLSISSPLTFACDISSQISLSSFAYQCQLPPFLSWTFAGDSSKISISFRTYRYLLEDPYLLSVSEIDECLRICCCPTERESLTCCHVTLNSYCRVLSQ